MSEKIEGTLRLEGLVEGPMPPFPDFGRKLEKWAEGFTGGKVRLSLQIDGGHFSALPSNQAVEARGIAPEGEPATAIADGLSELLRLFPPMERARVFSTLRSMEYRPGVEVQTLYAVGPDGHAVTREQRVPCETVKGFEPLSPRQMLRRGVTGILMAAIIVGISALFIDYPALWRQMTAQVEPATTRVEAGALAPYLRLEITGLDRRDGTLQVRVTRTELYPRDEAAWDRLYANPPEVLMGVPAAPASGPASGAASHAASGAASGTAPAASATAAASATSPAPDVPMSLLRRRLALEALSKGTVWLEFRDGTGAVIGGASLWTAALQNADVLETVVSAPVVKRQTVVPAAVHVMPR